MGNIMRIKRRVLYGDAPDNYPHLSARFITLCAPVGYTADSGRSNSPQ